MKHIKSYKFKDFFEQIEKGKYTDLNDDIWEFLEYDGWMDDESRPFIGKKGDNREDYEYMELQIPEIDEFNLLTFDDNTIEKYNEFDIELKDKIYDDGYLDLIDYENGKVFIVKLK